MLVRVSELKAKAKDLQEKTVLVQGWIRTNRDQKEFGFINLNDGSTVTNLQVVYDKDLDNFEEVSKFRVGCSLSVYGKVILTPEAPQPFELHASKIVLEGDFSITQVASENEYSYKEMVALTEDSVVEITTTL